MSSQRISVWRCWPLLLVCPGVWAQESGSVKSITPGRASSPPTIDGRMEAGEWSEATVIEDLHQVQPVEFSEASERSRIHVMYDSDALYVAARLFDREPERISANVLRQGEGIGSEDRFAVVLDTFHDRRNGYLFMVNANGVRRQALFQNTNNRNFDWKAIWNARTSRDAEGWVAEMIIPLKTISFDPASDTWGINFERHITRRNEIVAWSSRARRVNPSTSGVARQLAGLNQGLGLDLVPAASIRRQRQFGPGEEEVSFEPSLDVFYRVTPALTAALTLNTDFSATEVDDRQVNLSRFNLFFPEKRAFFLEGADIFEFGRLDASNDEESVLPAATRQNGRPFFSRQIGLSATGEPVDLRAGAKLTGRVGRWNVGLLDVQQARFGAVESRNLLVGRAAVNLLEESSLGAIVTHGDPRSNLSNSLAGVDFRYRNTRLPGNRLLEGEAWIQRSSTEGVEDDEGAYGLRLRLPNSTGWRADLGMKVLEENFNPALGFVNRRGVRDQTAEIGYARDSNSGFVQRIYGGIDAQRIDEIGEGLQTRLIALRPLELTSQSGDEIKLRSLLNTEVLRAPFAIFDEVIIPVGRYSFDEIEAEIATSRHRPIAGTLIVGRGDFYDGDRRKWVGEAVWRPSPHFAIVGRYEMNDIELPHGAFTTRLMRLRLDTVFSSTLSWSNFLQYDNLSETLGINSRVHWIPEAGREAFFVVNHGLEDLDRNDRFESAGSDLTLKVGYTFRF